MGQQLVARISRGAITTAVVFAMAGGASAHAEGDGYVTAGGGLANNNYRSAPVREITAGGEGIFAGRLGVGGDGTFLVADGTAALVGTLNASAHIREKSRALRLDPFARIGYSRAASLTE